MLARAGVPRTGWDLSDGSGMSVYNRLRRGPWSPCCAGPRRSLGPGLARSLPVAGVDGTLARRFRGTPLERRLFAKTGT
jgi:D-alanyl-D-alanine carboxypeptidase/D-alanyl-D-alanine-endopeptidase (penicillin-binding protein 4)